MLNDCFWKLDNPIMWYTYSLLLFLVVVLKTNVPIQQPKSHCHRKIVDRISHKLNRNHSLQLWLGLIVVQWYILFAKLYALSWAFNKKMKSPFVTVSKLNWIKEINIYKTRGVEKRKLLKQYDTFLINSFNKIYLYMVFKFMNTLGFYLNEVCIQLTEIGSY